MALLNRPDLSAELVELVHGFYVEMNVNEAIEYISKKIEIQEM